MRLKCLIILLLISILIFNIYTYYSYKQPEYIKDSIQYINDTLKTNIKSSEYRIIEIHNNYEEKINQLDTLSIDKHCIIFSNFTSSDSL